MVLKTLICCIVLGAAALFTLSGKSEDTGARIIREMSHSIVELTPPSNHETGGTGFAIRAPSGKEYTLTNRHVCSLAENGTLSARLRNGRYTLLRVLEASQETDLCILEHLPDTVPLKLARYARTKEQLYVLGHPLLQPNTLSSGYVVARQFINLLEPNLSWQPCPGTETDDPFSGRGCLMTIDAVATSIVIYPGNSGSPVMDASGEVQGVVFAGNEYTHYGLYVPLDAVYSFLSVY